MDYVKNRMVKPQRNTEIGLNWDQPDQNISSSDEIAYHSDYK